VRGKVNFMELLRQFGKGDLIDPLEVFGKIANLPEDATENLAYPPVIKYGPISARAFWQFLRDLPKAIGADDATTFVLGYEPLVESDDEDQKNWDRWRATFYQMAMDPEPAKQGDGSSLKYRERFLKLIYDELDPFLFPRLRFWLKQSGAQEDKGHVERRGRVVGEL
jgi:hypothetical protein